MQISRIRLSVWKFVFIAPVPRTFSESFHFGHDGIVQLGQAVCGSPHHLRIAPFDSPFGQYISYPHVLCLPFSRRGPSHPCQGIASRLAVARGIPTGIAPLPRYYGLIRLLLSLTLLAVLPSSLAGLSKHAAPFAPPRPRSPNRIGHEVLTSHIETCWSRGFRVNETLRRKFTCVAAYFFVRQDSRTSVALCTACPPNRMSISLRFSSFQLIVHAELCLAYLCQ